jgi:alpha-ribazole phosphatase
VSAGSGDRVLQWWWVRHAPAIGDPKILQSPEAPADLSNSAAIQHLANKLPANALWLTSDLRRALDTARALRIRNPAIPEPRIEPDLAEQNLGAWVGKTWDEIPEDLQDAFWTDPANNAPPDGESFADVFRRVSRRVRAITAEAGDGPVVMVGHSGPIRAALAMTIGDDLDRALRFELPHLSLTRIDADVCGGRQPVLASFRQAREAGATPALPPQL